MRSVTFMAAVPILYCGSHPRTWCRASQATVDAKSVDNGWSVGIGRISDSKVGPTALQTSLAYMLAKEM
jgi:hypothetical protein